MNRKQKIFDNRPSSENLNTELFWGLLIGLLAGTLSFIITAYFTAISHCNISGVHNTIILLILCLIYGFIAGYSDLIDHLAGFLTFTASITIVFGVIAILLLGWCWGLGAYLASILLLVIGAAIGIYTDFYYRRKRQKNDKQKKDC